jgi:hypothetical protein
MLYLKRDVSGLWGLCLNAKQVTAVLIRFVNYNVVGILVFPICTAIFGVAYLFFNAWVGWIVANFLGGFVHFAVLQFVNYKKSGSILLAPKDRKSQ